jgi:hypothetical protein
MVSPFSAGTLTLQEAPSFAWRTNGSTLSRERREHTTAILKYSRARIGGCNVVLGGTLLCLSSEIYYFDYYPTW